MNENPWPLSGRRGYSLYSESHPSFHQFCLARARRVYRFTLFVGRGREGGKERKKPTICYLARPPPLPSALASSRESDPAIFIEQTTKRSFASPRRVPLPLSSPPLPTFPGERSGVVRNLKNRPTAPTIFDNDAAESMNNIMVRDTLSSYRNDEAGHAS